MSVIDELKEWLKLDLKLLLACKQDTALMGNRGRWERLQSETSRISETLKKIEELEAQNTQLATEVIKKLHDRHKRDTDYCKQIEPINGRIQAREGEG